jgi:hypothetical protein
MFVDSIGFHDAVERLAGGTARERRRPSGDGGSKPDGNDQDKRKRFALDIWHAARPAEGTPVEAYLKRRGLVLPSSEVVRYHQACAFGGHKVPAMIALVRNIITNEPQAIHRTALDPHGKKVAFNLGAASLERMSLGPIKGGAVKLTDDAEVTQALGVGEGIESTLSLQSQAEWYGSPVWSLLDAGGIRSFPVLPGIQTLFVAIDHDKPDRHGRRTGQRAASEVNTRWLAAGREVLLGWSTAEGEDLNDLIQGADHGDRSV